MYIYIYFWNPVTTILLKLLLLGSRGQDPRSKHTFGYVVVIVAAVVVISIHLYFLFLLLFFIHCVVTTVGWMDGWTAGLLIPKPILVF